jgi:glycosyltransferase involved in cell wall biosynthesis
MQSIFMRVLIISHTYCEWNSRAKWRELARLYEHVEIKVITPTSWPDMLSEVVSKPEVLEFDGKKRFVVEPRHALLRGHEIYHVYTNIFLIIFKFKPDVIQVETGSNSLSLFCAILATKCLFLKTKIVFFSWINWIPKFGWKYRFFYEWIERFNLKHASGAILGNSESKRLFETAKGFKKQSVVAAQLGSDPVVFSRRNNKPALFTIGFAGRFVAEKGIDTLLDALVILQNKQVAFHCLLAGRGPHFDAISRKIQDLNLSSVCTLVGALAHQDMASFYKKCTVLVLPSYDTPVWKEQFGQVLVQAMLSGVIAIGSDAGAIPDVLGDSRLIFRQKDAAHLAEILQDLASDSSKQVVLEAVCYERAMSNFSHQAIAKQTHDFWQTL